MTAQYKPYRDEESVDGLETTSWTDNEPGSIQIYEKTTEELPFNPANKHSVWIHSAFYLATMILGFLMGYFMHFHSHEPVPGDVGTQSTVFNIFHEDATIKDKILANINGSSILKTLYEFADVERSPGSSGNHQFAAHVRKEFIAAGLDPVTSKNFTFNTMLPIKYSVLTILDKENKTIYTTSSTTAILPLSQADETTFVTDKLIYLNRGLKEDYTKLAGLGLNINDTEGKVFVIRQTFYQVHDVIITAQESGAKAVLLFPDPDTFGSNSPFPDSVRLPDDAAKSHPLAWSNYGDLAMFNLSSLTGVDVSKLGIDKDSKVHIPVVPITFNTARKLLVGLSGTPAPQEWNCFEFTLHIGPGYKENNGLDGRDKIQFEFFNRESTITTTTVTGVIAGTDETDRYIILGSRRDSLNKGVLDSVSGTAVMLEISRVFGKLVKGGWRPKRTIVFTSFGSESLNLVGSSNWLEAHQRLLHSRAVAYINCDLVVTGNQTVNIAASPLLYQVLYNSTRQVVDPNDRSESVYDSWEKHHKRHKFEEIRSTRPSDYHEFKNIIGEVEDQLDSAIKTALNSASPTGSSANQDVLGYCGDILSEYKKSATTRVRPKVRRLDLQSIYSPFFLYSGIPVVDVRFSGFTNARNSSGLVEDTLPLLGTKYDTMTAVQQIDPHLEYHVAVAKILGEIVRDLSDSVYLPFNLLDYAVTLRDSYEYLSRHHGRTLENLRLELGTLKQVINEFTEAAVKFHYRQDRVNPNNVLQVRKYNDQMMLLERAFLDPSGLPNYWERKHLILAPNDGQDHREGFPGLVDWITLLEGESLEDSDLAIFIEVLKVHYKAVIYTIFNAIKIIDEVYML